MTSAQPARAISLVSADGGAAQPARAVVLSPTIIAPPIGPVIPAATLNSGFGISISSKSPTIRVGQSGDGWNDAPPKQPETVTAWRPGIPANDEVAADWNKVPTLEIDSVATWAHFDAQVDGTKATLYGHPPARDEQSLYHWDGSIQNQDDELAAGYSHPPAKDRDSNYRFFRVDERGPIRALWAGGYNPPTLSPGVATLNAGLSGEPDVLTVRSTGRNASESAAVDFGFITADAYRGAIQPKNGGFSVPHAAPAPAEVELDTPWGLGSWERPDPGSYIKWVADPPEPVTPPAMPNILEVYVLMPDLSIVTVPGGDEIATLSASLTLDFDSWAWRLSATLVNPASLALVRPDSNGPKEINISINGYTWAFLVEGYGTDRSHGDERVSISGRSLSAWLGAPYAPKRSQEITAQYTAAQLADLELANTGYSIAWQAPDWVVPGGAWSYQETDPISAIAKLAAAVGAKVRPQLSSKILEVVPRFPASPHLWGAAQLDAILPEAMILKAGEQWRPSPTYNRAFVSGAGVGGVIVNGQRNGTAGDLLAPQVVDPLITHSTAGMERARIEMDKGGNWGDVSLSTFLPDAPAAPGLLLPGYLVEVQETAGNWRGQVGAVTINAASSNGSISVRQNLNLERFYS